MPPPPKPRVTPITWLIFILIFIPCDGVRALLFLLNVFVGPGTALDIIGSFIVSVAEILVGFGGLFLTGFYSGKGSIGNVVITGGLSTFLLTPVIDDLPFTSPTVFVMILKAMAEDKINIKAYELKNAAARKEKAAQIANYQAAREISKENMMRKLKAEVANDENEEDVYEEAA